MKPSWVILIMLFSINVGHTQGPEQIVLRWARQYSGESATIHDLAFDVQGNVYSIGEFKGTVDFDPGPGVVNLTAADKEDIFITKTNHAGNLVWAKRMGGEEEDIGTSIAIDALGQMYVTGYFSGVADFDPNNGVANLLPIGGEDVFICKLDTNGIFFWGLKVGGNEDDEAYDVSVDSNGDVLFAGLFNDTGDFDPGIGVATLNSAGDEDGFITKLDAGGIFVWAKRIGGTDDDAFNAFDLNVDDEVIATGRFSGVADFNPGAGTSNLMSNGKDDAFVLKLDVNGNFNWVRQFGSADDEEGLDIHVDGGNIYSTGYFNGIVDFDPGAGSFTLESDGESDVFISKLNEDGEMAWAKRFGSIGEEEGAAITTDLDGNVYTTGIFNGTVDFDPAAGEDYIAANGEINAFISKLTAAGEYIDAGILSTDLEIESNAILVDNAFQVYVAGVFEGGGDFDPGPGEYILTAIGETDAFLVGLNSCIPTASALDVSACEFYISPSGVHTWTVSGNYQDTLINASGCDSVLMINLAIHHSTEGEITVVECDEYTTPGGNFLTASGIYTEVLINAAGCDSVLVINLTILESSIFAQDITTCNSYVSPDGNEIYTETGTYYDTLTSSLGCDSVIVTYLVIDTLNTTVIYPIEGPTLLAEQTNANYQWLDCNNNYQPIPDATEQFFTTSENGSYAVIISVDDCIDTSACYSVLVGIKDVFINDGVKIYPNPSSRDITLALTDGFINGQLSVLDITGHEVLNQPCTGEREMKLQLNLEAGIYFVKMKSGEKYAVSKLVIEK